MRSLDLRSPYIVGYVRISKKEKRLGWSIENQSAFIRHFAEAHNLKLLEIFADIGRSGSSFRNRTGLGELLRLVQQGGVGAVVAWKEDRLGRKVLNALVLSHAIFAHGCHIITLNPLIDDPGPKGGDGDAALLLRPLLQIQAEDELARIRSRIVPGLRSAALNGRRGGHTPFGYRKIDANTYAIDPAEAAIVNRCFAAIIAGTSVSRLVKDFAAERYRKTNGRPLSQDLISWMLESEFYHGTLTYRLPQGVDGAGQILRHPGHHPAIVDAATATKVQRILAHRQDRRDQRHSLARDRASMSAPETASAGTPDPNDPPSAPALKAPTRSSSLTGLKRIDVLTAISGERIQRTHGILAPTVVRCGICGATMYASLQTCGGGKERYQVAAYLCHTHKSQGKALCAQLPARCDEIDAEVARRVRQAITAGRFRPLLQPTLPPDLTALDSHIGDRQTRLDRLRLVPLAGNAHQALRERAHVLEREITELIAERARAAQVHRMPTGPRWSVLQQFDTTWPTLDLATQRDVITWLVASAHIDQKRATALVFHDLTPPAIQLSGGEHAAG